MTKPHIQIVSPMWPSPENVIFGIFVQNICRELERLGFTLDTRVVVRGKSRGRLEKARKHLGFGLRIMASALTPADFVYLHCPTWFGPLVQVSARLKDKPVVVHMHGSELFPVSRTEHIAQPGVRWLAERAELIVVPSRYYAEELERQWAISKDRILVSPSGGVNRSVFHPLVREEARSGMGILPDAEVLGFVGRIELDKGWDTYLELLARLLPRRPQLFGLVVGDGTESEAFEAKARALGISDRLFRHRFRPQRELTVAYASMDALLFPTRRAAESLGLVPIEAMACGVPVVGSRISAVPEYVIDGETGFLVDPHREAEFSSAAERILDASPELKTRLRESSLKMAAEYDAGLVAERLAQAFHQLLEGRAKRPNGTGVL